jgi:hypothetical protein
MSNRPWVVVVRPDGTHVVRAIGPIKDEATANRVVRRIEHLEDLYVQALEANGLVQEHSLLPQAVELESVASFKTELMELIDEEERRG